MSELLKPPAVPLAILSFFSNQPDFLALEGDISEEFHQRAQIIGAKAAKRWYLREVLRNAWALTARELLRTPLLTTLVAFGCLQAVDVVRTLYAVVVMRYWRLPSLEIWLDSFTFIFITCFAMGWIGGRLLRGREWALALTFTLVSAFFIVPWAWHHNFFELPPFLRERVTVEIALRQCAFWLGSLGIRKSRSSMALAGRTV